MPKITGISALEILDSRGEPTVEVTVTTEGGTFGEAKVPSGASVGRYEAAELRDGDEKRYRGRGVREAVGHVRTEIQAALLGKDTANQTKIDRTLIELDGTPQKKRLGANALIGVSLAVARAEAASQGLPFYLYLQQLFPKRQMTLPVPQLNMISGGKHGNNNLSIQEYHVLPVGSPNYSEALRMGVEVYTHLRDVLVEEGYDATVGDEGGFSPRLKRSEDAFTILVRAIERAGYIPGVDVVLGVDVAAAQLYDSDKQHYRFDGAELSPNDLAHIYRTWRERYPIISIEDPFDEDAWSDWSTFTKTHGAMIQVIGDDIYVTNGQRIQRGILQTASNAVMIKPNQVGTLTETLQAILIAQEGKQNVIISQRAGETEDTGIADLAVAVGAGQIKAGAPNRSDRTAKYNRLLEIESLTGISLSHSVQPFLEHLKGAYQETAKLVV